MDFKNVIGLDQMCDHYFQFEIDFFIKRLEELAELWHNSRSRLYRDIKSLFIVFELYYPFAYFPDHFSRSSKNYGTEQAPSQDRINYTYTATNTHRALEHKIM